MNSGRFDFKSSWRMAAGFRWKTDILVLSRCLDLSPAFEPTAGAGDSDRLIHHPLADTEILLDPFRHVLVFAGSSIRLETGSDDSQIGHMLAAAESCLCRRRGQRSSIRIGILRRFTHVRPVERCIPARKAETRNNPELANRSTRNYTSENRTTEEEWLGRGLTEHRIECVMSQTSNL